MIAAAHDAGATATGILGSRSERARSNAERLDIPVGFTDPGEMLASRPDLVHVCTSNDTHARAITAAGIYVVLEKLVANTLENAREIAEAVRATGTIATVPYVYRYHPLVRGSAHDASPVTSRRAADAQVLPVGLVGLPGRSYLTRGPAR